MKKPETKTAKKPRVTVEMPADVSAQPTPPAHEPTTTKSTGNSSIDRRIDRKERRAAKRAAEEPAAPTAEAAPSEKLTKLDVPALQVRYLEVVGRPTGSTNKAYLVWKIREARKGRIPVGPRKSARREDVTFKILPLRMEATVVDKLDEAWKRQGLHSRMDLFRKSLHDYLVGVGENDVAALLTNAAAEKQ